MSSHGAASPGARPEPGLRLSPARPRLVETTLLPPAVVKLDREAFSLSRREPVLRRSLGLLAATLVRISGHGELGFSSLGDYSRERLGLSGRELQDLATVARRLESLPRIADAFGRGEISWSQTRLLASAARPETEERWLSRDRGKTVQALLGEIARWREHQASASSLTPEKPRPGQEERADDERPPDSEMDSPLEHTSHPENHSRTDNDWPPAEGRSPGGASLLRGAVEAERDLIDGEEALRFRTRCPMRIRLLLRRAVELSWRMIGFYGPLWQAADAIAGEGLSAPLNVEASPASGKAEPATAGPCGPIGGSEPGGGLPGGDFRGGLPPCLLESSVGSGSAGSRSCARRKRRGSPSGACRSKDGGSRWSRCR